MFGGQPMLKEQDLGVDIVRGWFIEGGGSILGVFLARL